MAAPEHFQLEEWDQIRINVEREFWEIQRRRLPILELCHAMAEEIGRDPLVMVALGGEWDFSEHQLLKGRGFTLTPNKVKNLRAVCRRELKDCEWSVHGTIGGDAYVVLTSDPSGHLSGAIG